MDRELKCEEIRCGWEGRFANIKETDYVVCPHCGGYLIFKKKEVKENESWEGCCTDNRDGTPFSRLGISLAHKGVSWGAKNQNKK